MKQGLGLLLLVAAAAAVCSVDAQAANVTVQPDSDDTPQISCRVHVVNNTDTDMTLEHTQSSLKVYQAADIMDLAVVVQLQHDDVAALEVSLSAKSTGSRAKRVVLKKANTNIRGGKDMVQTIFSDFAPNDFPLSASAAPYSAVYRPAEPLTFLSAGAGTLAGRGGSAGVWSLSVKDMRKPAAGQARTPLKLPGWELWLCGAANGPLFDPTSVQAQSGLAEKKVNVLRKTVEAVKGDVAVVQESLQQRAAKLRQQSALHHLNSDVAGTLVKNVAAINSKLAQVAPGLADKINGTVAQFAAGLSKLPQTLGYKMAGGSGLWQLTDPSAAGDAYRATLQHCVRDLYWCYENAGLGGNVMLDLTSNWEQLTAPSRERWAQVLNATVDTWQQLQGSDPEVAAWSDALFYSAIDTLYDAALANAIISVPEAYLQTAVRVLTYFSPLRFELDIRAAIVQAYELVQGVTNIVGYALNRLPFVVDGVVNNSIDDVLRAAQEMVSALETQVVQSANGLIAQAEQTQGAFASTVQQLVSDIGSQVDKFGDQIAATNPLIGAAFKSGVSGPLRDASAVAAAATKGIADYFKTQSNAPELSAEFEQTVQLLGDIFMALLDNVLSTLSDVEKTLEPLLPGPPPAELWANLQKQLSGIMADAQAALEKLVPSEEILQGTKILDATVQALLDTLGETVGGAAGPEGLANALNGITQVVKDLQKGVVNTMNKAVDGFPGPLVKNVLDVINMNAQAAADDINQAFANINKDFPNLDPKTLINSVQSTLEGLLSGTEGPLQLAVLTATNPAEAAKQLVSGIPTAVLAVNDALVGAQGVVKNLIPGVFGGDAANPRQGGQAVAIEDMDRSALTLSPEDAMLADQLQQQLGRTLDIFAGRIDDLTKRIPALPPMVSITSDITNRIASSASQLAAAALPRTSGGPVIPGPDAIAADILSSINGQLEQVLQDIQNQKPNVPALLDDLAKGPLGPVVLGLENTMKQIKQAVDSAVEQLQTLIPLPDLRQLLDNLLGPPVEGLSLAIKGAADAGVQLLNATSGDVVQGAAVGLEALGTALKQGEDQISQLLTNVATVGDLVNNALFNASAANTTGPLDNLAAAIAAQGEAATQRLNITLQALKPPPGVLEAVLRPVAAAVNPIAGVVIQGGAALPGVTNTLLTAMDNLAGIAGTVQKELGTLISQGLFSGVSPSQVLTPPEKLVGEIVNTVGTALQELAGNITGTVLAQPAPQKQDNATKAIQRLAETLQGTQQQLAAARAAIPAPGSVLNAVLGNSDALSSIRAAVESLQQPNGTDALAAASSALRQLVPPVSPGVTQPVPVVGGSLVAAGQNLLKDFQSSISNWAGGWAQPGAVANAFITGLQQGWNAGGSR